MYSVYSYRYIHVYLKYVFGVCFYEALLLTSNSVRPLYSDGISISWFLLIISAINVTFFEAQLENMCSYIPVVGLTPDPKLDPDPDPALALVSNPHRDSDPCSDGQWQQW